MSATRYGSALGGRFRSTAREIAARITSDDLPARAFASLPTRALNDSTGSTPFPLPVALPGRQDGRAAVAWRRWAWAIALSVTSVTWLGGGSVGGWTLPKS